MGKVIGAASDFYRLRLTRLDVTDEPDLEWRDDILYRKPPEQTLAECAQYRVEAVNADDDEDIKVVALFDDPEEAAAFLKGTEEDLMEMTKSAFESHYLEIEMDADPSC